MDAAVIAVVGTLAGVLIAAVAGLLTTVVTLRSQRQLTHEQASLQLTQQVRKDRKEAFVEYLTAYRLMYESALRIAYDDEFAELRGKKVKTTTPSRFEATFPQVVSQFGRSYYMLQIIAGGAVREAAKNANEALWALAHGSFGATEQEFLELDRSTSKTRNDIRSAMRIELGVNE